MIEKPKYKEKFFIDFLKKQGIIVKTNTKARGNLGICFKNRIDVSKHVEPEKKLQVLAHEYAHQIHLELEKNCFKTGGTLQKLFDIENVSDIEFELVNVTKYVDINSNFYDFHSKRKEIFSEVKKLELKIKIKYPEFRRSDDFKPIEKKLLKHKELKYLLKYDNVQIIHPIFRTKKYLSISTLEVDYPELNIEELFYLRIKSMRRYYKRLYAKKNKAQRYYSRPTELFARFVEGLFVDSEQVKNIAPITYQRFNTLLNNGYYNKLSIIQELVDVF